MLLPGIILACGALMIFASLLSQFIFHLLGHDQISYLVEAHRFLAGAEIYGPHLSETNPPMIIWFSALPVLFAHWMHGSPVLSLKLLVIAMIFGSVAWCFRILRHNAATTNPVAAILLACAVLTIEFSIGAYDFGQREHLLLILLIPYLLAAATGAVSRLSFAERCALGVAAGIAIWFKPQDALILVGLELFLSLRARNLRRVLAPEFLALFITSSFILLLVRVLTPRYLKDIFPLLFDTYWAMGSMNALPLALSRYGSLLCIAAALMACILLRRSLRDPATSIALLIGSFAAFIAFAVQHTAWKYHAYPHQALLLLAASYLLVDFFHPAIDRFTSNSHLIRRTVLVTSAASALMLCAIAIHPRLAHFAHMPPDSAELDLFFAQYKPSTTAYVFSTNVVPLSSVYNHGLNWGSRFAHLWMLPAIIQNELGPTGPPAPFKRLPPQTVARLATLQRTQSAEDLNYWRPSVVLIQHCTVKQSCAFIEGKDFDMLSWFLQSPEFAAAWSHYRQQQPGLEDFDVYKLVP
jgi:hypothetical protein